MKELQKYNVKLESEWNELYRLLLDKSETEEMRLNKKIALAELLSLIENKLEKLNEIRKELEQQLDHITGITSAMRLSEHESLVQKLSRVQALLGNVKNI